MSVEQVDPTQTKPTLDSKWAEMDKATKRVAVLQKQIARRDTANAKDKAEIHDIKAKLGVA